MSAVDWIYSMYDTVRESFSGLISKFIVAIIVLLIGFIIGKVLGRLVYKFLHSFEVNEALENLSGVKMSLEEIAEHFTTYFVYFVTIVMVLQQIGIATTILHMISAGIIVIIILSTFLGIKDFIPNAIAGFFILRNKFIKVGDVIKVKGMQGKISEITIVETKIETKNGDLIFIPNSVITKTEIVKIKKDKKKS